MSIADQVGQPSCDSPLDSASAKAFASRNPPSRSVEWQPDQDWARRPQAARGASGLQPGKHSSTEPTRLPCSARNEPAEKADDLPAPLQRLRRGKQRARSPTPNRSPGQSLPTSSSSQASSGTLSPTLSEDEGEVDGEGPEVCSCWCGAGGAEMCTDVACSSKS